MKTWCTNVRRHEPLTTACQHSKLSPNLSRPINFFFEYCSNTSPFFYGQYPNPGSGGTIAKFRSTQPTLRGRTPWFTDGTPYPGSGGIPANFWSTQPTLRGRTPWFTDATPHPGSGGIPANFWSTQPTLRGRTPWFTDGTRKQGAEESQPSFGLPSSPSEVKPRGLRTAAPTRERRNPSQVSVYLTHPQRLNPVVYRRHNTTKEWRNLDSLDSKISVYPTHPQRLNPVVYGQTPQPGSGGAPTNFRSTQTTLSVRALSIPTHKQHSPALIFLANPDSPPTATNQL